MRKTFYFIFIFLCQTTISQAQSIYETGDKSIQEFLQRLSRKKVIFLNNSILPYSKQEIRNQLRNINLKIQNSEKQMNEEQAKSEIKRKDGMMG